MTNQELRLKEKGAALDGADDKIFDQITEIGKLLRSPYLAYKNASDENKRRLVRSMVENFSWEQRNLTTTWKKPFDLVAKRMKTTNCGPYQIRTGDLLIANEALPARTERQPDMNVILAGYVRAGTN